MWFFRLLLEATRNINQTNLVVGRIFSVFLGLGIFIGVLLIFGIAHLMNLSCFKIEKRIFLCYIRKDVKFTNFLRFFTFCNIAVWWPYGCCLRVIGDNNQSSQVSSFLLPNRGFLKKKKLFPTYLCFPKKSFT